MIDVTRTQLLPGIHLTAVHTEKFKSSMLAVHFLLPLHGDTASMYALIPSVLRRGTQRHPDMEALSAALDELYGGALEPMVRRKGETQCVGFVGSFLDDAYTLEGEPILERAARLLGDLVLHPATEGGRFRSAYVEGERTNLINRIRAQINDKRQYALLRLTEEMCLREPFGVDKLGCEAAARDITGESLWQAYQNMLRTAPVELYYCGSARPERVKAALSSALNALPDTGLRTPPKKPGARRAPEQPRLVEEKLDVTQGKLALGLRTGGINVWSKQFPALLMCNAVFGGSTTSKLFLNVREKLSLCYYASSQVEKLKGVMLVSSGVEFGKVDQAREEILTQLENCRQGKIEPWELEAARSCVTSAYRSVLDSQSQLEDYWLGQAVAGVEETPEQLARRVEQVTGEQVAAAAEKLRLDTVYFLKGKEA